MAIDMPAWHVTPNLARRTLTKHPSPPRPPQPFEFAGSTGCCLWVAAGLMSTNVPVAVDAAKDRDGQGKPPPPALDSVVRRVCGTTFGVCVWKKSGR